MPDSGSQRSFIPGLELSRRFFNDAVQPIVTEQFPRLKFAAALIGPGSEVLGFDTETSTDHHWGPRVMLFLTVSDLDAHGASLDDELSQNLPVSFLGYSTHFGPPDDIGVRLLHPIAEGPVAHRIEISTVAEWLVHYLDWNPKRPPTIAEWLSFPEHRLRATTGGAIFRDDLGELTTVRKTLAWYPDDVWLYLLAAQWSRIAEEEAFMARCGDVGDEIGSTLVAARLVKDLIRLCFLIERQYPPYAKWFGTAFRQLTYAKQLESLLLQSVRQSTWHARQQTLSSAFEVVATLHNELKITPPLKPTVRRYYDRPYIVIGAERFASAIEAQITDHDVLRLPRRFGSLSQLIDATDKTESADQRRRLRRLYR